MPAPSRKPTDKAIADLPAWLEEHRHCWTSVGDDGLCIVCHDHNRTWTLEDGDGDA
jgi:hypothetical protein